MTLKELVEFEKEWLDEAGYTKENVIIALTAIKVHEQQPLRRDTDAVDKIITQIEQARDKDKLCEYPYNRCIEIIKKYMAESED